MIFALTVLGGIVGGALGWLLARRSRDAALRVMEMDLAAARAQLSGRDAALARVDHQVSQLTMQEEQLSGVLTTTRAEYARADAIGRMLATQVEQLRTSEATLEAQLNQAWAQLARAEAEARSAAERRETLEAQLGALEPLQQRAQVLSEALARTESLLDAERARTEERALEFERSRKAMRLEFEALGQKLLEEKGRSMLEQNHKSLEGLLTPVRERLKDFEDKFQLSSDQDSRDRASLLERLRILQETQSRLHEDASALSRALTGESRAQGDWGELVLESLLASAGLTEGREYELQVDHRNEEGGHRRPDALVYLPPNRAIVIDAKCSLQAFVASTRAASEEERESDLEAHVASLRTHVKLLSAKDYQSVLKERSLDFVFLFVPSEAAFHAALSRCPGLSEEALRQRVVVCSPTTVLATLQMVHHVWRSERQTLNAQRIAEEAGKMIDKLSAALESFNEVGERLNQAQNAFEGARGRLSNGKGNVLAIANKVVQLGARANKPERLLAAEKAMDAEPDPERSRSDGTSDQPGSERSGELAKAERPETDEETSLQTQLQLEAGA
ncbi:MAG: DNA recombination protein RmuC [Archangium sp.]|nr:DNA recombination protein RmuC [Archangium sp.]